MNNEQDIQDLQLHAFIDDELDEQERAILLTELERSNDTEQRLSDYRKIKDLVRHSYSSVPSPRRRAVSVPLTNRKPNTFMPGFFLVLGCVIGGVLSHLVLSGGGANEASLLTSDTTLSALSEKKNHFLLHLDSGDTATMSLALDRAETLVMNSSKSNPTIVEVITNSSGINLLRSDLSPYKERVAALANNNVLFTACARRIENLIESNQAVQLLPEAEYRYTAVERIVNGLQDGAYYEKIEI
jgi:intracellular sulfur oxidation DsrE/DsrF family protein